MKYRILILLLNIVFFSGCVQFESYAPNSGHLEGYVYVREISPMSITDETDEMEYEIIITAEPQNLSGYRGLSKADIIVSSGHQTTTGNSGYFRVRNIPQGNVTVRVDHKDLRYEISQDALIIAGETTSLTRYDGLFGGVGYYLIIGIENYENTPYNWLGAEKDARLIADALVRENSLARRELTVLVDGQATKKSIRDEITRIATDNRVGPDDYFVIYFSGRTDTDIYELDFIDHILPWDALYAANPDKLLESAITDGELEKWVRPFKGKDVTLILETNYSGSFIDGFVSQVSSLAFREYKEYGYTVMTATQQYEEAGYSNSLQQSIFTYYLADGLRKMTTPSGIITAEELYDYVITEMTIHFNKYNYQQHERQLPAFQDNLNGATVIYRY